MSNVAIIGGPSTRIIHAFCSEKGRRFMLRDNERAAVVTIVPTSPYTKAVGRIISQSHKQVHVGLCDLEGDPVCGMCEVTITAALLHAA